MLSSDHLHTLLEAMLHQENGNTPNNSAKDSPKDNQTTISPAKVLIIIGLLGSVFEVNSLQIDRNQNVNIVLSGSLKRKTEIDKLLDVVGNLSFKDVLKHY